MTNAANSDTPPLFAIDGENASPFGASEEEQAVRAALATIEEEKPLTGGRRALAQMCISLARNISAGNRKGRAVANEVAVLVSTMQALEATEETQTDVNDLPPELRTLALALGAAPRPGGPTAGDSAQL